MVSKAAHASPFAAASRSGIGLLAAALVTHLSFCIQALVSDRAL
jgi:hypothetical protein